MSAGRSALKVSPRAIRLLLVDDDAMVRQGLRSILEREPDLAVIADASTTFVDEQLVREAIHRGAKGYVLKDVDVAQLTRIIRDVDRGDAGFDSQSSAMIVRSMTPAAAPQPTSREREVLVSSPAVLPTARSPPSSRSASAPSSSTCAT